MHKIKKKIKSFYIIYILTFFIALADALVGYVQSSYLNNFVSLSKISLIIVISSIIVLFFATFYYKIIIKLTNYKTTLLILIFAIVSSFLLYFADSTQMAIVGFISRYLSFMLLATNLDVFLENISDNAHTGIIRTKFLTVANLAWLISPIFMSKIVGVHNHYNYVYLIGSALLFLGLILVIIYREHFQTTCNFKKHSISKALKILWKRKNIFIVWRASILLNIFYFVASIYVPIYLHQTIGLSWASLGIIFTIMLLPFVFFQIPAGIIADKYIGEKEMMIAGHFIMALSMGLVFVITTSNPIAWGALLFMSRLGAALAEAMQETYFYKKIDVQDIDLISIFRRSRSFGWLFGALIAFFVLEFFTLPYLFITMAIILLFNCLNLGKLIDTK